MHGVLVSYDIYYIYNNIGVKVYIVMDSEAEASRYFIIDLALVAILIYIIDKSSSKSS